MAWARSPDGGEFSHALAYESILSLTHSKHSDLYKCIWKWQGPERIKLLLWKVAREILLTNLTRNSRGMAPNDLCPICNAEPESIIHTIRDCHLAKATWNKILGNTSPNFYNFDDLQHWLFWNLSRRDIEGWSTVFAVTVDCLWWARNNYIFNNMIPDVVSSTIRINTMVTNIKEAWTEFNHRIPKSNNSSAASSNQNWIPPSSGTVKLNCDGAVKDYGSRAACGGIAGDSTGTFLWGFSAKLGQCSVVQSELWAILKSLEIAKVKGMSNLTIESDSLMAVKLIQQGCSSSHTCFILVCKISMLLKETRSPNILHICRDANNAADRMAREGFNTPDVCIYNSAPSFLFDNSTVRVACNDSTPLRVLI